MTSEQKPTVNPDLGVINKMAPAKEAPKSSEIKMEKVEGSSQIHSIGHSGRILRVQFHPGDIYEYGNVSEETFQQVKKGAGYDGSVGKAFNALIKKNPQLHPYRKL